MEGSVVKPMVLLGGMARVDAKDGDEGVEALTL